MQILERIKLVCLETVPRGLNMIIINYNLCLEHERNSQFNKLIFFLKKYSKSICLSGFNDFKSVEQRKTKSRITAIIIQLVIT